MNLFNSKSVKFRFIPKHYIKIEKRQVITALALLILFSEVSFAMRCGTHLISAGRGPGLSRITVYEKCGMPYMESGDTAIYMKRNTIYRLRFSNVNDNLVSIKREIAR